MQIWHWISINSRLDEKFLNAIDTFHFKYKIVNLPGGKSLHISFGLYESDINWKHINDLMTIFNISSRIETFFTDEEILQAEWVRLIPTFEHGYPQPEKTWVRNPVNYAYKCHNCGTFKQAAPFRIQHEPKIGKNDFMALIWGSALFCTKKVYNYLQGFGIMGYEAWDVIINKSNLPSQTIVQLYPSNTTKPGLLGTEELKPETCPECHNTKYYTHLRGVMQYKREAIDPNLDIVNTFEWFGGGSKSAHKELLISNRFARLIIENGWKGVRMKVVNLV